MNTTPAQFTDERNRTWRLELNYTLAKRLRDVTGLDFVNYQDGKALLAIHDSDEKLVQVLWLLCEPQAHAAGVLMRASSALVRLNPDEARWSDVIAAVRLAVQELRHEYGEDVTTVKVEAAGVIPEWAATVIQMEEQQLDWIVANLSLVGGAVES